MSIDDRMASLGGRGALFADDFKDGLRQSGDGPRWRIRPVGSLVSGDGVVNRSRDGITVEPPNTDPATGDPAFAIPDEASAAEHIRWAAFADHTASSGILGFDVPTDGVLTMSMGMSASFFGIRKHGLGSAVVDPDSDLRLGMAGMICVDLGSGMVFDFVLTNRRVFALYERLPRPNTTHSVFSYAVPVGEREPGQLHSFSVSTDIGANQVRWRLDGAEVLVVDGIGRRSLDSKYLKRDDGEREESVGLHQLSLGFGIFTDTVFGQGARLMASEASVRADSR